MKLSFKITKRGMIPGTKQWKTRLNAMVVGALTRALQFWQKERRPRHFRGDAAQVYGYTPRKGDPGSGVKFVGSYVYEKLLAVGHRRPLEYSGKLKRATAFARYSRTRTKGEAYPGAKLVLPMAGAANLRHPASKINMREELTTILQPEAHQMTRRAEKRLGELWHAAAETETVTIEG